VQTKIVGTSEDARVVPNSTQLWMRRNRKQRNRSAGRVVPSYSGKLRYSAPVHVVSGLANGLHHDPYCLITECTHHSPDDLHSNSLRHFALCSNHFAIYLCRVAFHNLKFTELPLTTFFPSVLVLPVFLNLFSAFPVPHSQRATPRGSYDPQSALQVYDFPDVIGVS
jgi:hypothetical protein